MTRIPNQLKVKRVDTPASLLSILLVAVAAAALVIGGVSVQAQSLLPEVSITPQGDVTEGTDAVFVVRASSAPSSSLSVAVNVRELPYSGTVATLSDTGPKTVTIPAGQETATLRVGTEDDTTREPRGMITAVLTTPGGGAGYRLSQAARYGTVVVSDDDDALPEISISAFSNWEKKERENSGAVWFTLTASALPPQAVVVHLNVTATGDFGVKTGAMTAIIPSVGDGDTRLKVPLIRDRVHEPDGSVTVTVQPGSDYVVASPSAATIILIDDDTPRVSVAAAGDVTEGTDATFTVTASPTPYYPLPVSLNLVASGLSGVNDGARTVTVPTSGSATLAASTTDDNVYSQGGSITATVQPGSGYVVATASSAVVNVADNDGPAVSIVGGGDVTEGTDATFTLTASSSPYNYLSVDITVETKGEFGVTAAGRQTVTIPTSGTATFTASTADDSQDEPDGSVTAKINPGHDYNVGSPSSATVTVLDDDDTPANNPVVTISPGPDINEGETATFTITATPPVPAGEHIDVSIAGEVPGALNIPWTERITGATTTISQFSVDNNYDEADYPLSLILRAGSGYTLGDPSRASVTVIDDDVPQVSVEAVLNPRLAPKDGILEDGTALFRIKVEPWPYQELTVSVTVATEGDFGVQTGSRELTVPAKRNDISLYISPVPDHVHEDDGSITVTVNSGSDYDVGAPSSATIAVYDDDPAGAQLSIHDADEKARAGGKLEFSVRLSQAVAGEVSVDYELNTFSHLLYPGWDFQDDDGGVSGTLVFAAGEIEKVLNVHIHPDAPFRHNDRIYVALDNLVGDAEFGYSFAVGRLDAN